MTKPFVYAHWLERNPVGAVAISFHAECCGEHTAESLHKLLGDRRQEWRPDDSADSLTRIEWMLKSLSRAS